MTVRRAFIAGIASQDGPCQAELLPQNGYTIVGMEIHTMRAGSIGLVTETCREH